MSEKGWYDYGEGSEKMKRDIAKSARENPVPNLYEKCKQLQSALTTANEENQSFGNVLAVIHGDGGHYITKHGHDKASKDAIAIVLELRDKLTAANEENKRLREGLMEVTKYNAASDIKRIVDEALKEIGHGQKKY